MTPEDEEFARLEREARMRMRQIDEDFEREYAKWEHSPKHQMFKLMDELALARVLIRELGDRLARIEAGHTRNDVIEEVAKEIEKFTAFGIDTVQSFAVYIRGMKI
jgi:hypothetical protein